MITKQDTIPDMKFWCKRCERKEGFESVWCERFDKNENIVEFTFICENCIQKEEKLVDA